MKKGVFVKILNKWNHEKGQYEKWGVPAEWNIGIFEKNLSHKVDCCKCGKTFKFGDCYSSQEFHTDLGFGYATCEKCHKEELKRLKVKSWNDFDFYGHVPHID